MPPKPKPPVVETITRYQDATRVWFVGVRDSQGRRGNVLVNAPTWDKAGQKAVDLGGGEIETLRAETFTLNELMWDEE